MWNIRVGQARLVLNLSEIVGEKLEVLKLRLAPMRCFYTWLGVITQCWLKLLTFLKIKTKNRSVIQPLFVSEAWLAGITWCLLAVTALWYNIIYCIIMVTNIIYTTYHTCCIMCSILLYQSFLLSCGSLLVTRLCRIQSFETGTILLISDNNYTGGKPL